MLYLFIIKLLYFLILLSFSSANIDIIGYNEYYLVEKDETLIDISRKHNLAFPEVMSANPQISDPWILENNKKILLPKRHILPKGNQDGLIINIADLRAYYFYNSENDIEVFSYPIGVGRSGWETPLGKSIVIDKKKNPYWTVPKSILEEDPSWPKVVKPGPDNPLGKHAIYLSLPSYLLHGTNKAWGVGMRVSHGCIRMYPEGIKELFSFVKKGTNVEIVNQPIKVGWDNETLYIEVHVMHDYGREPEFVESPKINLLPEAARIIQEKAGIKIGMIVWDRVVKAVREASGMPIAITN